HQPNQFQPMPSHLEPSPWKCTAMPPSTPSPAAAASLVLQLGLSSQSAQPCALPPAVSPSQIISESPDAALLPAPPESPAPSVPAFPPPGTTVHGGHRQPLCKNTSNSGTPRAYGGRRRAGSWGRQWRVRSI